MTVYTLFGQPSAPSTLTADNNPYTMGVQFSVSQTATLTAIWWWSAPGAAVAPVTIALFAVLGRTLTHSESATWSGAAGSGWIRAAFTSPPSLTAAASYKAAVLGNTGSTGNWYAATSHFWDTGPGSGGITNGPLSAPAFGAADGGQDTFSASASLAYPNDSFGAANYWADPEITVAGGTGPGLLMACFP